MCYPNLFMVLTESTFDRTMKLRCRDESTSVEGGNCAGYVLMRKKYASALDLFLIQRINYA
jgi:hypothetical protein